jgi:3-phenylpropionate/cinnamic acid dioxygenase small subunit
MGSNKGAQLTYLNKGDKVFNNDKTMDLLMFNDNLNSILTNNGISNPSIEVNNSGITDAQINRLVNSIENSEKVNIYNDGTNILMKRKKANQLIEIANRRINFTGKSV